MFKCRACGTESDSRVCPMCGAECAFVGDEWQTPFGSPQENAPKQHKKMAPPPSPINQPALLKDASPVFDPSASAVDTEALPRPKPQKNFNEERAEQRKLRAARAENTAKVVPPSAPLPENKPTVVTAKKVQSTAKKIAPEPPQQDNKESISTQKPSAEREAAALKLPSDESRTPAESVLIEKSPLTEAETIDKETEKTEAEVSADISVDSGALITSEGAAEEASEEAPPPAEEAPELPAEAEPPHEAEEAAPVDEVQDEIGPELVEVVEPEETEDAELVDFSDNFAQEKSDSKFRHWLKNDAMGALAILDRLVGGKAEQPDAEAGMGKGWCLLIPAHLAAIILAGLCGWRLKNAGVFSGVLSSVGASAIIWLEHTVLLTLLTSITLISVKKPERLPSLLARVMTAFLPFCASTVPAFIVVGFVKSLCVPLLLLGAGLSLIEVYNAMTDAGVTGKKLGMLRLTAFLLVYILSIGFLAGQFL